MKSITLVLGVMMTLAMAAPADVIVDVGTGVSVGSGLTSYTVWLVAETPADWVTGFDGEFGGPMNQIKYGTLYTPTLDNASQLADPGQDSHFLFLNAELLIDTVAETANSLTGVFGVKESYRAESLEFAQIVLADGASIPLIGEVGTVAGGSPVDISTIIPEPASMSLLGLGALAIIRRRRRK